MFNKGEIAITAICYNEELLIEAWIKHLLESTYIGAIIIVDTGSTDKTVEIIERYQKSFKHITLLHTDWEKDFSYVRNIALSAARDQGFVWAAWIDIDTFFNENPDDFFQTCTYINNIKLKNIGQIRFPTLRAGHKNYLLQFKEPTPQHWSLINLSNCSGFRGSLHEQLSYVGADINVGGDFSPNHVVLIHYDIAKIVAEASLAGVSSAYVMGKKKHRYLQIRKLAGTLSQTDPDPDAMTRNDIEMFGSVKMGDELSVNQLFYSQVRHSNYLEDVLWPK